MDGPSRIQDLFREKKSRVFKVLGHPTRLRLLEELRHGDRCVCDLAEASGAGVPTVSKHLSVLKQVGLVGDQKRGQQVFYRLSAPCVFQFIDCIETVVYRQVREDAALIAERGHDNADGDGAARPTDLPHHDPEVPTEQAF